MGEGEGGGLSKRGQDLVLLQGTPDIVETFNVTSLP